MRKKFNKEKIKKIDLETAVKMADGISLAREEVVNKKFSKSQSDWLKIEKSLSNVIANHGNVELLRNACVEILLFMKRVGSDVWRKYTDKYLNIIEEAFQGIDKVDIYKCPTTKMGDINIFRYITEGTYFQLFKPDETVNLYFNSNTFIKEWRKIAGYESNGDNEYSVDKYTPPVTKAELSQKLSLSIASVSNKDRPMGRIFNEYCILQGTDRPRLPYDKLYPIARECIRRSRQNGADELNVNTVNDLIDLFVMG